MVGNKNGMRMEKEELGYNIKIENLIWRYYKCHDYYVKKGVSY